MHIKRTLNYTYFKNKTHFILTAAIVTTFWKWCIYTCTNTLCNLANILLHKFEKFFGNGLSLVQGNRSWLFICISIQSMRWLIYSLAGRGVGFLNLSPSAHKYSNLGPPDIVGHVCTVQNSHIVPYIRLMRLKKSTTKKTVRKIWFYLCILRKLYPTMNSYPVI